jgi:hypothetical protein
MLSQPRLTIDYATYQSEVSDPSTGTVNLKKGSHPSLGSKTTVLFTLRSLGIPVPTFLAVPTTTVERLWPGTPDQGAGPSSVAFRGY